MTYRDTFEFPSSPAELNLTKLGANQIPNAMCQLWVFIQSNDKDDRLSFCFDDTILNRNWRNLRGSKLPMSTTEPVISDQSLN